MDGYDIVISPATKGLLGRPSAGLLIGVRSDQNLKMLRTTARSYGVLAVLIEWNPASVPLNRRSKQPSSPPLALITTYWNPQRTTTQLFCQTMAEVIDEILIEWNTPFILVCGDLNAKCSQQKTVPKKSTEATEAEHRGQAWMTLMASRNLHNVAWIREGQTLLPTWERGRSTATLDYIFASQALCAAIQDFKVVKTAASDHNLLTTSWSSSARHSTYYLPSIETNPQQSRLRLTLANIRAITDQYVAEFGIDQPSRPSSRPDYLPMLLKYRHHPAAGLATPKSCNHQYDMETAGRKNGLRNLRRRAKATNTVEAWDRWRTEKKAYKSWIRARRAVLYQQDAESMMKVLNAKKTADFWDLVNATQGSTTYNMSNSVPEQVWVTFFTDLFASPTQDMISSFDTTGAPWIDLSLISGISTAIQKLKSSRAPGSDGLSNIDLKKHHVEWAAFMSILFDHCRSTRQIPSSWCKATIIPIFKRGSREAPENYRPIALLDIMGKLFATLLLDHFHRWEKAAPCSDPYQLGFKKNGSTTLNIFILSILKAKIKQGAPVVYAAFIDLSQAFDKVDRPRLWRKLENWKCPPAILHPILALHTNTSLNVRLNKQGALSRNIQAHRGVKQGCPLAPALFVAFLGDFKDSEALVRCFPPKFGNLPLSRLLYADDMILFDQTPIGLQRQLDNLAIYMTTNNLQINQTKTKIMILSSSRHPPKPTGSWSVCETRIEVVHQFKYLGVLLDGSSHEIKMQQHLWTKTKQLTSQLRALDRKFGKFSLMPAINFYKGKVVPSLTYGMDAMFTVPPQLWRKLEAYIWKSLLGLPNAIPIEAIRRELGLLSLSATVSGAALALFRKTLIKDSLPIFKIIGQELESTTTKSVQKWVYLQKTKLEGLQCSLNDLITNPQRVSEKLKLQDWITTVDKAASTKCLNHLPPTYNKLKLPMTYCLRFPDKKLRSTFLRARLNLLHTREILGRRLQASSITCRLCEDNGSVENIRHLLLNCPALNDIRAPFLTPLWHDSVLIEEHTWWCRLISGEKYRWAVVTAKILEAAFLKIGGLASDLPNMAV